MSEIIRAENLHKVFLQGENKIHVLKDVNLTIDKEEILGIVGPSGAGKSTLLYILGFLTKPTEGVVFFNGREINWSDEKELTTFRNKTIGFIFQFHHLLPDFTALENVMLPAFVGGGDYSYFMNNAIKLLEDVGLKERINHRPGELSGGEQQRVAIARALINDPELILADEPTGDLDAIQSEIVWKLLYDLVKEKKSTLLVVTHNEELTKSANRILHIYDGKIL